LGESSAATYRLGADGEAVTVSAPDRGRRVVEWQGQTFRLERTPAPTVEETATHTGSGGAGGRLSAPMPGRVVKVVVEAGEHVSQNQPLVVLEAMKMEHIVEAPYPGIVAEVRVQVGEQVVSGTHLLTIGSSEAGQDVE
jgi:3-methylcrotonyl-CoA carboxylase alpha subunit